MKYHIIIALTIVVTSVLSIGFDDIFKSNDTYRTTKGGKYEKEWAQVDSLDRLGLPKSALQIVDIIYKKADAENNFDQIIKATLYRMKYVNMVEEDAFETIIQNLEQEAKIAKFPNNAMLHSILAEMYWIYYQNNRWKFYKRSETINFVNNDIKTWDLNKLVDKVIKHYRKSLENKGELQKTSIDIYDEVIVDYELTKRIRPTLYDFLAYRATSFFANTEIALSRPANKFILAEGFYFAETEDFINENIKTNDTLSLQFNGIEIFQDLLRFRLKDDNKDALINAELNRLEFVYTNSVNEIKDSLYLQSLLMLEKQFEDIPYSAEISYLIAGYYKSKANEFNALNNTTRKYKWYNKKAYDVCLKTIKKFPDETGSLKCKSLKSTIESHNISTDIEEVLPSNTIFPVKISYKNISKAYLRIAKIDYNKLMRLKEKLWGEKLLDKLIEESEIISQESINLPFDGDYNLHSTEYLSEGLPVGTYIVFSSNNEKFSYRKNMVAFSVFHVSNISFASRQKNDRSYDIYVFDRKTGYPLQNVKIDQFVSKYDYTFRRYKDIKAGTFHTDKDGYAEIPELNNNNYYDYSLVFSNGNDILHSSNAFYSGYYENDNKLQYSITIFTDRAIYRPGQTVYFKGIALDISGKEKKIATKFPVTVTFFDVNYQKITELKLTTNEYGTFSGTFEIPTGILNGSMQISTSYGTKYISVEEYKRPKFEVKMLPFDGNYLLNDSVEVKGEAKTFSGAMLTGAMVKYRVVRTPVFRGWWAWYWGFPVTTTEIANGTTTTNDNGQYSIQFKAIPDLSVPKSNEIDFNYSIYVDVTDINGETQSTQKHIVIGYTSLVLSTDIYDKVNKNDKDTFKIFATNLNGEAINAKGYLTIYKLKDVDVPLRKRRWAMPDEYIYTGAEWKEKFPGNVYKDENDISKLEKEKQIFKTNFNTEKSRQLKLAKLKNWETGRYVVEMTSTDAFGNKVKSKTYFTLFDTKPGKMPVNEIDLFIPLATKAKPGEFAKFIIGSAEENVKVLWEIELKDKIIQKEWITLNNEQKLIEIGVKEAYRGNFTVHFTFVKNNRFYTHSLTIIVPYSNKVLDIEFETFRNKLLPGENEEWKIKIKGPKGEKVAAEMLATLYDASLDQFKTNYWDFYVYENNYSSLYFAANMFGISSSALYKLHFDEYIQMPYVQTEYLNWFGFNYYGNYRYNYALSGAGKLTGKNGHSRTMAMEKTSNDKDFDMYAEAEEVPAKAPAASALREKNKIDDITTVAQEQGLIGGRGEINNAGGLNTVKTRTNFNETAFFFPHLMTNKDGDVIIKFTIPESLTKWKMMGMAHTKDLKLGFVNKELITQKELMIMPNPPRFFRENDKIEFPVKITNLTEKELKGEIRIELFDAITMQPIDKIFAKGEKILKEFTVKQKQNSLVTWKLTIPEGVQAIQYKVVAKAGKHSDGEEKALPVLSNRMLVTESMPLPIRGMQTKTFKFNKLINSGQSSTLRHQRVTLEFTSNPAWYAVQALPYLMEYPYECAEQVFSRYYANSLATHIANSSPKIKRVFDAWKNTPSSKVLLSNLEKNQELKALLLEETPWVLNSQSETERKKRIGLLFDLNKMSNELNTAIRKLEKMQSVNGGWPWFKGMPESRYITQHIIAGMGHLDNLGVKNVREEKNVWKMIVSGIKYLDNRIKEDYDYLKKHYTQKELKEKHIGSIQIQYLYARSYFNDVPVSAKSREAVEYYTKQAKKYWLTENKYMQGMIALALYRSDNAKTGINVEHQIMASLKETSINSEEMGMYWKDNAGYYWYQAPVERHALLIEAFDEIENDAESVENLKVWLLKQKQTQDWKTTKATVEAVYALLLRGGNWLESNQLVEVKLGDMVVDPKKLDDVKIEAGTGYFKTSWGKGEINPEMGNITVTKKDEGIAWGAIYWQYFEQLDKITPHETPVKLEKKLFVERSTEAGKVIEPVKNKDKLKVGDKIIVRIELRVDRAMEYVHMKDMRAAGFEPVNVISKYKYQDGLGYYETTKDAATNFFISYMPKGTYVFEYPLRVQHRGDFSNGITSVQCMYAPEFASHSEGIRVKVE